MSFDAYLKLDGIPGESTDDKHKDWIEILSYSHHMSQPASASHSTAGGSSSARVAFGTLDIVHLLDKASPKLFEACAKGTHIKEATIELCRAGGDKFKYQEIKLEQVLVANLASSGSPSGGGNFPTETVSFTYGKIKTTYFTQNEKGGGAGQVAAGWDLTANKAIA